MSVEKEMPIKLKEEPMSKKSVIQRSISKLNKKRRRLRRKIDKRLSRNSISLNDELEYTDRQNSVATLDLFKYSQVRERLAICLGFAFMIYAASWQPISVFILATMASLMGHYAKQTSWVHQLIEKNNNSGSNIPCGQTLEWSTMNDSGHNKVALNSDNFHQNQSPASYDDKTYESLPLLEPLHNFVGPIFDLGSGSSQTTATTTNPADGNTNSSIYGDDNKVEGAIHEILLHESRQFLKRSFEINGSAFLLGLSQLIAFFIGMNLITWAAKKQASRLKILYFQSCLHQEVTWFESIDSASGSGSSLNALVDKYEDGIGQKLALLCYFLGHVTLFACTAFYQMFSLALFCIVFVVTVGLIIIYLSELQAISIGEHALFAKRSLQLAEEILASIRTVFAFNGQQKELTRYSLSLNPVYRKSLIKHLFTALNTSLSKFSIFACFSAYCFHAMYLFPPYTDGFGLNKATVLAVMRGGEVSIVNILISIPFMEALQQSKGSIARIYATIERLSKINPSSGRGVKPNSDVWLPSISFRMVQFGYADRAGPTQRRRPTLPQLSLAGVGELDHRHTSVVSASKQSRRKSIGGPLVLINPEEQHVNRQSTRRRSIIDQLVDEFADDVDEQDRPHPFMSSRNNIKFENFKGKDNSIQTAVDRKASLNHSMRKNNLDRGITNGADRHHALKDKLILNKFNLEIKAGQSVALVGPSGSGKSTVLSLVQRLYDITGGQLLVGQHDIKDLNVQWLRNQIGVVTQEPRLFDMSIADNIRLGLPSNLAGTANDSRDASNLVTQISDMDTMQQVIEASKLAGAHDFVCKLPQGYDTKVGSGGVQLSGGQKQRIAIARALIRKPSILLLDETTSALDTESEMKVQEALHSASIGKTTITVAHRLQTIKHVDLIVVMNQGQVIECGTHTELMSLNNGTYKKMYQDQIDVVGGQKQRLTYKSIDEKTTGVHLDKINFIYDNPDGKADRFMIKEGEEEYDEDENIIDDSSDDDDDDDDDLSSESCSTKGLDKPTFWMLLQFIELPKWGSGAAVVVCLLAGLILPMNLIAHSYLFSAFAYNELDQIGEYLYFFGLVVLSFSTFVFIVSFLQVMLPGYVGEKISIRMRAKTMDSFLNKPMFYFDMDSNSAGALCERLNSYISDIQNIAGARIATILEAVSTLAAGAIFGFGQNLTLSMFCLSFALLVLITTVIESRIVQRESSAQQRYDAQLAHLMSDCLSNIKTIASLNKEKFFISKFTDLIHQREKSSGRGIVWLRTFLTSLKFVMPALSWSASMYYGSYLLTVNRIDLQTIFIVCPVVLFAVNDTFRALVFLPELIKARKSIERLHRMNSEFSPQVLQTLSLAQQLEQQNRLHLEQMADAASNFYSNIAVAANGDRAATNKMSIVLTATSDDYNTDSSMQPSTRGGLTMPATLTSTTNNDTSDSLVSPNATQGDGHAITTKTDSDVITGNRKPKKSISFIEPANNNTNETTLSPSIAEANSNELQQINQQQIINRRLSNLAILPTYMRRKSSRLNSLVPRYQSRGKIEFQDVEFAYPNRPSALVLDGFSLIVAPGESVALVGGSGSGKSTCVSILEKFYDYHGGKVTIDGHDLRLVDPNWVRSQIGLVSQEPTLLSYTIGDNIRYGDNSRFVSMDEVIEAARLANIHEFIMSLPDQYDTELSTSAYSSSQLSGGQRQRIAIARALVRNAPILIFDEATSALDSCNEAVVQDALNKARKGRTSLTIAHRLSTIKDADKIVVLNEGRVVEIGKHDELIKRPNGHYRGLWEKHEGGSSDGSVGGGNTLKATI